MSREAAFSALFAAVSAAYPWNLASRRMKLWSEVPPSARPSLFQLESGPETYQWTNQAVPRRALEAKLFLYFDARDPTTPGSTAINDALDALDAALAPQGLDLATGRQTLGGAVYDCRITGVPVRDGNLELKAMINLAAEVREGKLSWQAPPGRWHVMAITEDRLFEGTHASLSLSEHIPYPNLLQPEPIARFLEVTHQAYAQHLGNNLGQWFISTFTDEPSLMSLFLRRMPYRVLPWSPNLVAEFKKRRGYALEPVVQGRRVGGRGMTIGTRSANWYRTATSAKSSAGARSIGCFPAGTC